MRLNIFPEWFSSRDDATEILGKIWNHQWGYSPNIFRDLWVAFFEGPDTEPRLMGFRDQQDLFDYYLEFNPARKNLKWLYNTQECKYFDFKFQPFLESIDQEKHV